MITRRFFLLQLLPLLLLFNLGLLQAQPAITLSVDATDVSRKILHARETISVQPGALTLLYPKWIPGEHGPTGPVVDVAGLKVTAGNFTLSWRRDLEDMYAIHCDVPAGAGAVDLTFDFILPPQAEGFSSGASSTSQLLVLSWNQVVLYPGSARPDDIIVTPSVTLPEGWKYVSALTTKEQSGNTIRFAPVSLTMLVDSPVQAGAHFRRIDLTPPGGVPHFLNVVSDGEAALDMSEDQVTAYRQLVVEANALFGAHHYDHYDFLYTLSDQVAHFGLEHHQCSDDRQGERTLLDDDFKKISTGLLPHEFVHSWNGKYRRPTGLATGDFSSPMKGDLLWIYEGLTQYLGKILTARSGLQTFEAYRDDLALLAAWLDNRPGREWRPLQDVNDEAQLLYGARGDWDAWRRAVDFYDEGILVWLEADVTVRQLTGGKKSLDDFCRKFHGNESRGPEVKPYTINDVVATLNEVAPSDWKTFFATRLQSLNPHAPLGGVEKSGWKLGYDDTPNDMEKAIEGALKINDFRYSIGVLLKDDGMIVDVIPGTPAAKAGIGPGMKLVAVNSRKYSKDILGEALKLGKKSAAALEVLAANGDFYKTYSVDYHGGERYPHLERDGSKPDILSLIIGPAAAKQQKQKSKK